MTRAFRIYKRRKKMLQRWSIIQSIGLQQGTLYEKHRNKIQKSLGYVADGNLSHYASVRPRKHYNRKKETHIDQLGEY